MHASKSEDQSAALAERVLASVLQSPGVWRQVPGRTQEGWKIKRIVREEALRRVTNMLELMDIPHSSSSRGFVIRTLNPDT